MFSCRLAGGRGMVIGEMGKGRADGEGRLVLVFCLWVMCLCRVGCVSVNLVEGLADGEQVPSNLFLNKIGKPALYLPTAMVVWGVISAATAAAQSYGGLLAIRFMLGFVEAAYFVSVMLAMCLKG